MPLGDSLTAGGYNDSTGWHIDGGYREHLYNLTAQAKIEIDFVGRLSHGNFADTQHEGYSGWKIHEVDAITEEAIKLAKPDVILLVVGGNDLFRDYEVKTAPERYLALVEKILKAAPNARLFAGSTLKTSSPIYNRRVKRFNKKIARYVSELQKENKNLVWVDMFKESTITADDTTDGVHPTYDGYKKMAEVWYRVLSANNLLVP